MKKLFYYTVFFEVLLVPFIFSFQASDTFQGPKALVFYAAAIILAGAAAFSVLKGHALRVHVPALLAWLAFTLVSAATLFFAADKYTAVFGDRHVESVAFYLAGFFTLLGVLQLDHDQWSKVLDIVVYQGPIFSVLVLVQSFFQVLTYDYANSFLTRGDAATGNPIYAAYFLVLAVAATLCATFRATSFWQRCVLGTFLFLEVWALLMTGSRSGWLGLGAVLVIFFAWAVAKPASGWLRLQVLAPVCVGAAFLVLLALFTLVLRVDAPLVQSGVSAAPTSSQSISDRFAVWRSALSAFSQHPVLGVGADNFASYYVQHMTVSLNSAQYEAYDQAHNIVLQILVTTGILGGLCVALFFWYALRRSWKILRGGDAVQVAYLGGLVGILVAAMFNPLDVVSWVAILLCAAMLLSRDAEPVHFSGRGWRTVAVGTLVASAICALATAAVAAGDVAYNAGSQTTDLSTQLRWYSRAIALDPVVPGYLMAYDTAYAEKYDALPPFMRRLTELEPHVGMTYARNGGVEAYVGITTKNSKLLSDGLEDLKRGASIDRGYPPTLLDAAGWDIATGHLDEAAAYLQSTLKLDSTNVHVYEVLADVYTKQGKFREGYDVLMRAYLLNPANSQELKRILQNAALHGYRVNLPIDYQMSAS